MSSSEGTPQIFETCPVPQGRSDLDVTFHWVSKREGESLRCQEKVTEQLIRQILKLPKCEDPGAKLICSKDEKTENPLLVPIWVKLDINHSLKRCRGCLWSEGLRPFPNSASLILANTRRESPTGGTFCVTEQMRPGLQLKDPARFQVDLAQDGAHPI